MTAKATRSLFFALLGIILFAMHYLYVPLGADYFYTFSPAAVAWQNGTPVFSPPYFGFFNAPWLLFALVPLQWLTLKGAEAGLTLITLAGIVSGWRLFARGYSGYAQAISLAIALANLHTFDLLQRGQIDVFVLFSVMMIYVGLKRNNPYWIGAGWLMSGVRPTSICLLLIFSAWVAYRRGYLLRALIIPAAGLIASLLIFDPGWIGRWYTMLTFNAPPQPGPWLVTWWHAASFLGLSPAVPALITIVLLAITVYVQLRCNPDLRTTAAFLIAASLCVVPYALSYHYIVLLVVCVPLVLNERLWLALPLFLLTLTPVLRFYFGTESSWIDIVFPLVLWLLLIWKIAIADRADVPALARRSLKA